MLMLDVMDDAPVKKERVKKWTAKDVTLSRVHHYVLTGWSSTVELQLMPFFTRRLELSACDGCVLWGARCHPTARTTTAVKVAASVSSRNVEDEGS